MAGMSRVTKLFQKLAALLFLVVVALVPFLIVVLYSRQGGIWVLGYVSGIITVPLVGFGAVRAIISLDEEGALIGTVVFGVIVIVISLILASWSLLGSPPQL
jgi:hypothetical protein